MDPLKDLAGSRPVIFYDQIGNGRSTHLPEKPTSFWSIDLFVAELENVVRFFSLLNYDIVGHSWGGMLAAEYAYRHPPLWGLFGLHKMVLTDANPQRSLSIQSQAQLLKQFPEDVQMQVMAGWSDPPMYRQGLERFFQVHGCTLSPWPVELTSSFDALFEDPTVSQQT
jgi:pimeloyl-ACP methyl ester carboxylesterase